MADIIKPNAEIFAYRFESLIIANGLPDYEKGTETKGIYVPGVETVVSVLRNYVSVTPGVPEYDDFPIFGAASGEKCAKTLKVHK